MCDRSAIPKLVILSVLSLFLAAYGSIVLAQQAATTNSTAAYQITTLTSDIAENTLTIEITGDSKPTYTVAEKFSPFRMVLDVAGATFGGAVADSIAQFPVNPIAKLAVSDLEAQQPVIKRFEFEIADTHDYQVDSTEKGIKITISPATKAPQGQKAIVAITDIKVDSTPDKTTIHLVSTEPIKDYKVGTLAGNANQPARMYVDLQDISITQIVREKEIGTTVTRMRVAPRGTGARFVFDAAGASLFAYDIAESEKGLAITVNEKSNIPEIGATPKAETTKQDSVSDSTLDELIESSSDMLADTSPPASATESDSLQDTFSFSGYNKQRISVDFYKIDIHNVFRLFRQITDLNIIVDEGVQGTLTLALTDVPWDFALDIILNLQDLAKEERFNTIVIYPKKKVFAWPQRAEDNLSFEADVEVVEQDALIIQELANQPQEVLQAKEILRKAYAAEKADNFEIAAEHYEEAAKLWPDNSQIYNRLATLYLVNLGVNAKAHHHAKTALALDPKNHKAALYAAIASANMQRLGDASEYFSQAVSGDPPMKEALFSFSSFNENNGQNDSALKLMEKYESYYGETLDTMLAKARLYDKMGQSQKATEQYKAIMASGYQMRPDLKKYISGRIAAASN